MNMPINKKYFKQIEKNLKFGKKQQAGRNNTGRITVWSRGGGHKRSIRKILFQRHIFQDIVGTETDSRLTFITRRIAYDPRRSAPIALISVDLNSLKENQINNIKTRNDVYLEHKTNICFFYMILPKGVSIDNEFYTSLQIEESMDDLDLFPGKSLKIENVPLGTLIHNIESKKRIGSTLVRAAGTYAQVIEKPTSTRLVRVRLPSSQDQMIPYGCFVSIGTVSRTENSLKRSKAGRTRWLSKRPTVRGVAMNPVDHPHGGGEGKTSGGRPSVTPWGRLTKNFKRQKKQKNL